MFDFSPLCVQMGPKIVCLGRCIVTLVAFVQLFSTIVFSNEPSNRIFEKMLVTLVAFIGFVSTPCIVTLVAFVSLFPTIVEYWKFVGEKSPKR